MTTPNRAVQLLNKFANNSNADMYYFGITQICAWPQPNPQIINGEYDNTTTHCDNFVRNVKHTIVKNTEPPGVWLIDLQDLDDQQLQNFIENNPTVLEEDGKVVVRKE